MSVVAAFALAIGLVVVGEVLHHLRLDDERVLVLNKRVGANAKYLPNIIPCIVDVVPTHRVQQAVGIVVGQRPRRSQVSWDLREVAGVGVEEAEMLIAVREGNHHTSAGIFAGDQLRS